MRPLAYLAATAALSASGLHAQDCSIPFTQPQFPVRSETAIAYDTVVRYDGQTEVLYLDIHKPVGDGQTQRPLVIMVHGGGFTGGHRNDMTELCATMASYGYVAATISYRLSFHPPALLPVPFPYDMAEVSRAAYRAQLDTRSALHFMRERAALDSSLANRVILLGGSAGAINVLHATFGQSEEFRPEGTGALPPVTLPGGTYPRPDLGPMVGVSTEEDIASILAVVPLLGAISDTAMISDPNGPALFMYHQTGDPVVGCYHQPGLWGMPFNISDSYPYLFGSCVINDRLDHLGYPDHKRSFIMVNGNEHEVTNVPSVMAQVVGFLRMQLCSAAAARENSAEHTPLLYPNPTSGPLHIGLPEAAHAITVVVRDIQGRVVARPRAVGSMIDLSMLPAGTYLVSIASPTGVRQQRVVRE